MLIPDRARVAQEIPAQHLVDDAAAVAALLRQPRRLEELSGAAQIQREGQGVRAFASGADAGLAAFLDLSGQAGAPDLEQGFGLVADQGA